MDDEQALELQRRLRRFDRRQRAERPRVDGVTSRAVLVLGAIARAPRPVQPSDLAAELEMASSNVAAALRELEAAGHVSRERDRDDGRRVAILLSAAGEAAVAEHRAARAGWLRRAADATLTEDEQEQLLRAAGLLERLSAWPGGAG